MMRRPAVLLVAWLGLLWSASPVLACTLAADPDCCPPGVTSPCSGGGSGVDLSAFAALCCARAPAASPAVSAACTRTIHVSPLDSGSPDGVVAIAWFVTPTPFNYAPPLSLPDVAATRTDAALTYLHTRRLRL